MREGPSGSGGQCGRADACAPRRCRADAGLMVGERRVRAWRGWRVGGRDEGGGYMGMRERLDLIIRGFLGHAPIIEGVKLTDSPG